MMAAQDCIEVGLGVVHPWLCDAMGHLTTRHYMAMFDDASYHLLARLGYDPGIASVQGWGWADVHHEIDYFSELSAGALVRIEAHISAISRSSIMAEYRLNDRADGRICAALKARTVCFDLGKRKSRELPSFIREHAALLFDISSVHESVISPGQRKPSL